MELNIIILNYFNSLVIFGRFYMQLDFVYISITILLICVIIIFTVFQIIAYKCNRIYRTIRTHFCRIFCNYTFCLFFHGSNHFLANVFNRRCIFIQSFHGIFLFRLGRDHFIIFYIIFHIIRI